MSHVTLSPADTQRWTRTGRLAALALLLGYVESFVPIPIPGIRLGLANIPVLVALSSRDTSAAISVAAIKVLASGLLFGSPVTLAFSAAGTALSLAAMVALSRLRTMRLTMTSVVGALLHVMGQLLMAQLLIGTTAVWYASPILMAAGCATGAFSGWLAQRICSQMDAKGHQINSATPATIVTPERPSVGLTLGSVAWIAFVVVVLHLRNLHLLGLCCLFSIALCLIARVSTKSVSLALRPLLAIAVITALMQVVIHGPNMDSLTQAAAAVLRLVSIVASSTALAKLVPADNLAGVVAWVVSPLARLGVSTVGFSLALAIAVDTTPRLVKTTQKRLTRHDNKLSPKELADLLPDLICDVFDAPS